MCKTCVHTEEVNPLKRLMLALVTAIAMVAIFTPVANAFTMSEKVVVANNLVAIARVPAGGMTADQRINTVNDRLAYIYGYEPLNPDAIKLTVCNGERTIRVGNTTLITVTPADAKANNTTVDGLAQQWLRLAKASLPQARPTPSIPG